MWLQKGWRLPKMMEIDRSKVSTHLNKTSQPNSEYDWLKDKESETLLDRMMINWLIKRYSN